MKYCTKCGAELTDETKFCPSCGQATEAKNENVNNDAKKEEYQKKIEDAVTDFVNTKDETDGFDPDDINKNKALSILSYIGFLFIIPLIAAPQSKFAKFHANQGLILFIAEAVIGVASSIVTTIGYFIASFIGGLFSAVFSLVGIVSFIFMVIGIINAVQGKAKELPIIGGFRFLK